MKDASRYLHDMLFRDVSQSLCARAWAKKDASRFWACWTFVFGKKHCAASWRWYHDR